MDVRRELGEPQFEIKNANLYDPGENQTHENIDLIFDNGKLVTYGQGSCSSSDANLTFDLKNRWVMPPLVDCHLHPAPTANPELNDSTVNSMLERYGPLQHGQIHANLREAVLSGVLAVREMGSNRDIIHEYDPYRNDSCPPQLTSCVQPVTGVEGHISGVAKEINNETDCHSLISDLKGAGASHVKVANDPITIEFELLNHLVDLAHDADLPVACHAHSTEAIEMAIRAGCDTVEHAFPPSEELASIANDNGTVFIPTYYCAKASLLPRTFTNIPTENRQVYEDWLNNLKVYAEVALKTDVDIALGTDAGMPPVGFGDLWKEAWTLSKAGFSTHQLLEAATVTGAKVLGLDDEWTINEESSTHLIVVDEDPREDIMNLQTASPIVFSGSPLVSVLDDLLDPVSDI